MLVSVSGGVFLSGCSSARLTEPVHKMGELTTVGPVIYNVLETEWRNQLGDSIQGAVPQNKFLLVRLTVTPYGHQLGEPGSGDSLTPSGG